MEVRRAKTEELDSIYMMGYDVWSDGVTEQCYLDDCRSSEKYQLGTWYVLTDEQELLSSLIVYSAAFNIPVGYSGIGSVATDRASRKHGHANRLVSSVCDILQSEGAKGVYLHSDISVSFYERLGFFVLPSTEKCMVRLFCPLLPLPKTSPDYF